MFEVTKQRLHYAPWTKNNISHGFTNAANSLSLNSLGANTPPPEKLLLLNQVHGTTGHLILNSADLENFKNLEEPTGDFFIVDKTIAPNEKTIFAIKTADCIPVILKAGNFFAIVHAGWRGLCAGIIEIVITKLNALSAVEEVLIGPCADQCCYEVGLEVIDAFRGAAQYNKREDSYYLSLPNTAEDILSRASVPRVRKSGICTICNPDFHSYRRDGKEAGRNLTFLTI